MEYHSVTKKDKVLPFVTTRMDLEGNMLNKIVRQRKINIM